MSHDSTKPSVKRREFLKVLGVGGAAVAASACAPEPTGKLIPYFVSPDETVPGVSTYYATTCRECAAACGVIAETRDGRVIKLEGNPDHPLSRGGLCARGQASLQGLYNPDRLRRPMLKQNGEWKTITWDEALTTLSQQLGTARSRGTATNAAFINQHETGSFPAFLDAWLAAFGMKPHVDVDFEADQAVLEANRRAYGAAWPKLDFGAAKLIVSFGGDFLETWGASVPQQLDFADARGKIEGAPRFVYVGPRRSLTGLNADNWIPCAPGSELAIVNFLAGKGSADQAAKESGVPAVQLQQLQSELAAAKPSLILAGARGDNALELAMAVNALNQAQGNVGTTIRPDQAVAAFDGTGRLDDLLDTVERMRAGQVPLAFVRGTNPAYYLPASYKFADAFAKVSFKVAFSMYPDETTELCDLVLPDLHSLESWGDAQSVRGTISMQQPAMDPVFPDTRGCADVLIALARKDPATAAKYAFNDYRTWLIGRFPGGEKAFAAALPRGVAAGSLGAGTTAAAAAPAAPAAARRPQPIASTQGDFVLVTYPSPTLGSGGGANKPWLQELPDPVMKAVWSSWVELHPETAERLGIDRGDILEVTTAAGKVQAPAMPYLGVRPDVIAIPSGQGHRSKESLPHFVPGETRMQWGYGRYARDVGVNVFDLLAAGVDNGGGFVWTSTRASIRKIGQQITVPSTEGSARQFGRGIAQAIPLEELLRGAKEKEREIPGDASHTFLPGLRSPVAADAQGSLGAPSAANQGKNKGMYDPKNPLQLTKRRWAMTIDLARCTGCSACVVACYAENNIPTVGARWQRPSVLATDEAGFNITRGREMNWIRLERYYEGNPDAKFGEEWEARFTPMLCQHCGNAPCEPVCPVYATYHSPDGLNVQVYNRCVGTRYCSNGCPYKVRYFNWFGYGEPDRRQYAFPEPLNWQLNPDVTVRGKGVMEKCTMCVQRIREAENRAALEQREVMPDEFTTSCAAACPSRAITFGDAADPQWTVAQLAQDRRAYHVFEELNTYTAVVYLKKVQHPGPGASAPAVRG